MNRIVIGAVSALLLAAAGLFWWQGRAATEQGAPLPVMPEAPLADEPLPYADAAGLRGAAPPEVSEVTREQRRFDRLDRDRDSRITANEMLAPRAAVFRKLDADGNNLLTFQEWAVKTETRFKSADANRDNALNRAEFATTKAKPGKQPACRCAPREKPARAARTPRTKAPEPPVEEELADEEEEPAT
jgi:hypothetical protein